MSGICPTEVLVDISNYSDNNSLNQTNYKLIPRKKLIYHNVPTGILVNFSGSNDSSDYDSINPIIPPKSELAKHPNDNTSNNSIITDDVLWDPRNRLDYYDSNRNLVEKVATNRETAIAEDENWNQIKHQNQLARSNVPTKGADSATKHSNGETAEKTAVTRNKKPTSSELAITSTPTDSQAPNVDENFRIFKKFEDIVFWSSPTEHLRRSVVSSSAGSVAASLKDFSRPQTSDLKPVVLFNEASKKLCSKPAVPSRRTSAFHGTLKTAQVAPKAAPSIDQNSIAIGDQKSKVNLKTRMSLAPPPRPPAKLASKPTSCDPIQKTNPLLPTAGGKPPEAPLTTLTTKQSSYYGNKQSSYYGNKDASKPVKDCNSKVAETGNHGGKQSVLLETSRRINKDESRASGPRDTLLKKHPDGNGQDGKELGSHGNKEFKSKLRLRVGSGSAKKITDGEKRVGNGAGRVLSLDRKTLEANKNVACVAVCKTKPPVKPAEKPPIRAAARLPPVQLKSSVSKFEPGGQSKASCGSQSKSSAASRRLSSSQAKK